MNNLKRTIRKDACSLLYMPTGKFKSFHVLNAKPKRLLTNFYFGWSRTKWPYLCTCTCNGEVFLLLFTKSSKLTAGGTIQGNLSATTSLHEWSQELTLEEGEAPFLLLTPTSSNAEHHEYFVSSHRSRRLAFTSMGFVFVGCSTVDDLQHWTLPEQADPVGFSGTALLAQGQRRRLK